MKFVFALVPLMLFSCRSAQFSLGSGAAKTDECSAGGCEVDASCLPNGNCLISCTNAAGETCEVELACNGGQCQVVRSDCSGSSCCATASASGQKP